VGDLTKGTQLPIHVIITSFLKIADKILLLLNLLYRLTPVLPEFRAREPC
jgi:hypothetical protein